MHSVIWIVSALVAGTLARVVMKGQGRGFIGDVVLGALGSVSGAWLLRSVEGEAPAGGLAHVATAFHDVVLTDLPKPSVRDDGHVPLAHGNRADTSMNLSKQLRVWNA